MNILPKKRWHVRTKDNVARVRRDEAKAAEEEKRAKERIALAEQEFRTKALRQKATDRKTTEGLLQLTSPPTNDEDITIQSSDGHINFFADLELQARTFGKNKEYEEEKKQQKEEEERKIGILKYLGEGSAEYMKITPWWSKVPKRPEAEKKISQSPKETLPINNNHSDFSIQNLETNPRLANKRKRSEEKTERKKKKKHKHNHKHRHKHSSKDQKHKKTPSSSSEDLSKIEIIEESKPSLQKLREERLKRESEERLKAEKLIKRRRGEDEQNEKCPPAPSVKQKYNSQFNPDLARQNRDES